MTAGSARVAILSGGSHGFGRAVARALARNGFTVVLLHSPGSRLAAESTLAELRDLSPRSIALPVDVADAGEVVDVFGEVLATWGRIDAVINLAGYLTVTPLADLGLDELDRLHRTVVRGTFVLCRQAASAMGRGGCILNLTSAAVDLALPGTSAYVAAKAAVEAMTRVLAEELRERDISVFALSTGPTSNELALTGAAMEDEAVADIAMNLLDHAGRVGDE